MLDTKGLFALEYSFQQNAWRIEDLEVALKYNIGWFAKGEPGNDYRILAMSDSRSSLRDFKNSLAEQTNQKEVVEWWSNGVMQKLSKVESFGFLAFSNTPILQHSKIACNLYHKPIYLSPGPKDQISGTLIKSALPLEFCLHLLSHLRQLDVQNGFGGGKQTYFPPKPRM